MSIDGDASGVTGCHVQQRGDDTPQELPVDGVFIYVAGSKPITGKPCLHSPATCHLPPPCEAASECMQLAQTSSRRRSTTRTTAASPSTTK